MCFRSSLNACRSSSLAKYLFAARPRRDRVDDAADQLLDAALALGRADLAAEILRDDDVGRLLRPGLRDLDVALLEHHLAALVADHRRAQLPFDLVERIDAGLGEEARERQPRRGGSAFACARGFVGARPTPATCAVRRSSRPSAGRHLRPGRQRRLSCSRSIRSGDPPEIAAIALPPRGDRQAVCGNSTARTLSSREKLGVLAEARRRSATADQICAQLARFVKRVNTTYCASLLGQSQDVDSLWISMAIPHDIARRP